MQKKRIFGLSLIILGIVIFFLKPITSITGFAVANESLSVIQDVWFILAGAGMMLSGVLLSYQAQAQAYREQTERESKLKKLIGNEQYGKISEEDKQAINKSYRRYLEKSRIEKEVETISPEAKNLAQEILESGAIITDPKKLVRIAKEIGYRIESSKEGTRVLTLDGKNLTDIPSHDISTGVYRSVIRALATGETSYRRRTGYSHT